MTEPNTQTGLEAEFAAIGVRAGMTLMVHSSLGQIGWTVGGPVTVVRALMAALGPAGTLVMSAETPQFGDPSGWKDPRVRPEWHDIIRAHLPVFDRATSPTAMGAIAEAFRTYPGTVRSDHPIVSVCANGPNAAGIVAQQPFDFCEGDDGPYGRLHDLDAHTLLIGVGFNRCTSMHHAESLVAKRRTLVCRVLVERDGERQWADMSGMAHDESVHFPAAGAEFVETRQVRLGKVGKAEAMFFSTRAMVAHARGYFERVL